LMTMSSSSDWHFSGVIIYIFFFLSGHAFARALLKVTKGEKRRMVT